MLRRESLGQSLRFTILGAFQSNRPQLTLTIQTLFGEVPELFETLLPRSERGPSNNGALVGLQKDDLASRDDSDAEKEDAVVADDMHKHPWLISKMSRALVQSENSPHPSSPAEIARGSWFDLQLRKAYEDYDMYNIFARTTRAIRWYTKLSYNDPYILTPLTFDSDVTDYECRES